MVGKICTFSMPYYDNKTKRNSFKARPCLVIYGPTNNDYTVLPISTISRPEDRDSKFDYPLIPSDVPNLRLPRISYVRTHKQTPVHRGQFHEQKSDLKKEYPDKYEEIMQRNKEFNTMIQTENGKET